MIEKKTILEVNLHELPAEVRKDLTWQYENFLKGDTSFRLPSDLNEEPLSENLTMKSIEDYYKEQQYDEPLDVFIKDYGFVFEVWLIEYLEEHNITLDGINEIYIKVD